MNVPATGREFAAQLQAVYRVSVVARRCGAVPCMALAALCSPVVHRGAIRATTVSAASASHLLSPS